MIFREAEVLFYNQLKDIYPDYEIEAIMHATISLLFGFSRFELHLKANNTLPEKTVTQIYNIIHQLKQQKPIQYILGETEFYGLVFKVDERVLIPRPETEELVQWIISDFGTHENCCVLDIGAGSGCIAISITKNIENAVVYALDISEDAINVAQENARLNSADIRFLVGNILSPDFAINENFDVIVSNPPYITAEQKEDMVSNVIDFEPHIALFADNDNPFVYYEAIASFAKKNLKSNGYLYFEINEKYPEETAAAINKYGFVTEVRRDINNKYRMIKAWRNG